MFGEKRSFFERLTGSMPAADAAPTADEPIYQPPQQTTTPPQSSSSSRPNENNGSHVQLAVSRNGNRTDWLQSDEEGQLTVDMFQTPEHIVIQSTVAGVEKEQLEVSLSRDMVTLRGKRSPTHRVGKDDYFNQELYWGMFSRTVLLPQEVDAEAAEATMKNGLLTIRMPKLDKNRVQKIRVKSE